MINLYALLSHNFLKVTIGASVTKVKEHGIKDSNLWEGKTHVIDNAGHAPFRETPAEFDAYLARFIQNCTK